jgi:hypothetical protein
LAWFPEITGDRDMVAMKAVEPNTTFSFHFQIYEIVAKPPKHFVKHCLYLHPSGDTLLASRGARDGTPSSTSI